VDWNSFVVINKLRKNVQKRNQRKAKGKAQSQELPWEKKCRGINGRREGTCRDWKQKSKEFLGAAPIEIFKQQKRGGGGGWEGGGRKGGKK